MNKKWLAGFLTLIAVATTAHVTLAVPSYSIIAPALSQKLLTPVLFERKKEAPPAPENQYPIQDEESFQKRTKSYHKTPFNDPKLEFDILLPRDWKADAFAQKTDLPDTSRKILGDVAYFKSPMINTQQVTVTVKSLNLDHQITAENWLKQYVFMNGYAIQGDVIPVNEKRAAVYFISNSDGKSSYNYAVVQINLNVAMLAQFDVPLGIKDQMAFVQKRVIDSFRLILETDNPVEPQKTFTLADALKINYPQSWTLHQPDFKDTSHMSVQIHNENPVSKKVEGLIRFVAVRRTNDTNLLKEVEKLKEYFNNFLGVNIKKMESSGPISVYDRFLFSRYENYLVEPNKNYLTDQRRSQDKEVHLVVLGDKNWYIFVFLYTPSDQGDFSAWAHNTAAFDLIVKSLK